MIRFSALAAATAVLAGLAASNAVLAHGKVTCNAGPQSEWKPIEELKARLAKEGWTIAKAKTWKDCYEVYGTMADGKKVEAFFQPVTLDKVQILQRGKVVYPTS